MRIALTGAGVLALACSLVTAQTRPSASTDDRIKQLDEEVRQLREEVTRLQQPTTASPTTDRTQSILDQIDSDAKARSTLTERKSVSFNPDLAVVGDFKGSVSTNNNNPARNRFDLMSVELDLRAPVAPIADAVVVLPISRDIDDPLFPPPGEADGAVDTGIEIEEAYLFLHDFGVPNLTAKLGRFHLRFGRQNILHEHDWPTVDNNFVNQSFLGTEAIADAGLSLSYVIPPKLLHDHYVELITEIISGEGSDEQPVENNSANIDSPALNLHALWNHDIAANWNLEVGTSALFTKHNDDNSEVAHLYGGDATLIHTDPTGGFNNQVFGWEAIYGDVDTTPADTQHAFGTYLWAQQQLNRDWYAGCRLDWTENALDDKQEVWGVSPYITWYYFEFLRFRLEYQHKEGDVPSENNLYFQCTFIFGAHPPHPYWAMK